MTEYIIGIYFAFIILIGIIFYSIKYLFIERKIIDWNEFLLLAFFPIIGLGNWIYNRENRNNRKTEFPKKWYIWKKMISINIWFFGILTITSIVSTVLFFFSDFFKDISRNDFFTGSFKDFGDMFNSIIVLMILFGVVIGLTIIWLILILIPKLKVKSIEKEHYKNKAELKQTE